MDPITVAARRLLAERRTAWNPPPGAAAPPPRILRIEVAPQHRADALKALRLEEWQPDNRRPFSILELPFLDEASYLGGVCHAVKADVDKVDQGLREDGVSRAPAPPPPSAPSPFAAAAYLEQCAAHLAGFLDGLAVVLAPKTLSDESSFARLCLAVAAGRTEGNALQLDALAPGLESALPQAARFVVDDEELFRYLRDLGTQGSEGPAADVPGLPPERRRALEAELGQPLVSLDAGRTLKRLLLDGAKALHDGRPKDAVRKYRAARTLTEATGLKNENLLATMALGTAYATVGNPRAAAASYERARRLAMAARRPDVAAQALFGLGYVYMNERRWADAAGAYSAVLPLLADDSPLKGEARRLISAAQHGDPSHGLDLSPGAKP